MAETSLAHQPLLSPETRARVLRGLKLFQERGHEIEPANRPATFYVPACSSDECYEVALGDLDDHVSCGCPDFQRRRSSCKHIFCLQVWISKRNRRRSRERGPRPSRAEIAAVAARLFTLAA